MNAEKLNVTYYLGAGASAKGLPIITNSKKGEGMGDKFRLIAKQILNLNKMYDPGLKEYVERLIVNLNWLADKTEEFTTPDTFAKFLKLTDSDALIRLKNAMSAYFCIEQLYNNKFDNRALIFLTSILQN